MEIIIQYVLAFIAGALVKSVDYLEDERKTSNAVKIPLALAYGLLIGYLISTASFSVLFLAALVAQVLARKIDTLSHRLGFLVAILSPLYFGFPPLDVALFAGFLALAFLDEVDYIGALRPFNKYRPFLKAGALLPAFIGVWDYFFGIMVFDIGYELMRLVLRSGPPTPKADARREGKEENKVAERLPEGPAGKTSDAAPKPAAKPKRRRRKKQ